MLPGPAAQTRTLSPVQPLFLDSVAHFARTTPTQLAIHDLTDGTRLTYSQLDDAIDRAASVLTAALGGKPKGERIAVLSRNSAQMLVIHLACVRSGAIFVPLNWRLAAGRDRLHAR